MNEKQILARYLPEGSVDMVYHWIRAHQIHLRISRRRSTKLGDYRPPTRHPNHRISINHDLNPYAFLITFVHELAHLLVFEKYGNKVLPHGIEWKREYRELIRACITEGLFPPELESVLQLTLKQTKASSNSDLKLSRLLKKYDAPSESVPLENLTPGTLFRTDNGRQFRKGEKIRTRFKCLNMQNQRVYLFHPLAPVTPVK